MMHGQDGVVVVGHREQLCVVGDRVQDGMVGIPGSVVRDRVVGDRVVGDRVQDGVVGIPGSVVGGWVPDGVVGSYGGVAV